MIRIGIVGMGSMGMAKLNYLNTDRRFEVVGIVDPGVQAHNSLPLLPDVATLVRDTGADVVDISSPPVHHHRHAMDALAAGAHVICEKPLATAVPLVEEIQQAAADARRMVYPVRNYLFSPDYLLVRRLVDSGSIGAVMSVTFEVGRPSHARGSARWKPDWRTDPTIAGGGVLTDHGSHYFYLGPRLLGAPVTDVSARIDGVGNGCETSARVELGAGAARCVIDLSWTAPERTNRWQIIGSLGRLSIENGRVSVDPPGLLSEAGLPDTPPLEPIATTSNHEDWFGRMYTDVAATLKELAVHADVLREGVRVVELLDLAYASARRNVTLNLNQAREPEMSSCAKGV